MGKPKKSAAKKKKQGGGGKKPGGGAEAGAPPQTPAGLMEHAQSLLDNQEFDQALAALHQAAQMAPDNVEVVEALGELLAEVQQEEQAVAVLQRAVQLSPNEGFEKFMLLGQLLDGEPAVSSVRHGINLVRQAGEGLAARGDSEGAAEMQGALAQGLCQLAELHISQAGDECPSEAVAAECEALLTQASELAPGSPEPLQTFASLRMQQKRGEEGLALLRQSMALWMAPSGVDLQEWAMDPANGDALPSFEFRFETSKLLLEVEQPKEAVRVLELNLLENDSAPDVWYMLAVIHRGLEEYDQALECLEAGAKLLKGLPPEDETVDMFAEMRADVERSLAAAGGAGGVGGGGGGAGGGGGDDDMEG